MNIHNKTQNLLGNSIKISSAILLIIGASLIIPKIADAALSLDRGVLKYANPAVQKGLDGYGKDYQDSLGYQPPDFGLPASAYGSGTR